MSSNLVTIRAFSKLWETDFARATLEANCIHAYVVDANTISVNWLYSNAIGGVKVQVPEKYEKSAREVLQR